MGSVINLAAMIHARASSLILKPNTVGETSRPLAAKASRMTKKLSCEILPLALQLLTAEGPSPVSRAAAAGPSNASITSSTVESMPQSSSRGVNLSSLHGLELERGPVVHSNRRMAESLKSLGNRLKHTREALGLSAAELCKTIDCKPNRWSQYENGERKITLEIADRLCDEFGLTLDWIYRNDPAMLPHAIRVKIRHAA